MAPPRQCFRRAQAHSAGARTASRILSFPNEPWCLLLVISRYRRFRALPSRSSHPIQGASARMLPTLLDVFEKDPVVEPAAFGPLAVRL
jgi:hypothetical protein